MNAIEIEEAVSELAAQPFDADTFPYEFLRAFRGCGAAPCAPGACARGYRRG